MFSFGQFFAAFPQLGFSSGARKKKEKKKSGAIISFCFSIINCLDIKDTVLDLDFEGFNGKQHL